jgi:MFS family permease
MENKDPISIGKRVTLAGVGINLALGILYAWSVIKASIPEAWGWTDAQKSDPYALACFVFAATMIPAGKLQDKIAPRWVASIGGISVGFGCILAGFAGSSYLGFVIGFGLLGGIGMGFGYAATTPASVKWFPPEKTGVIAGVVVAGFGLAPVYIAPLAEFFLSRYGISGTMILFGVLFLFVVVGLAQLLQNPSADYAPDSKTATHKKTNHTTLPAVDVGWRHMTRSANFWVLWVMYLCGSAAGLMVIGSAAGMAKLSLGNLSFIAVAVLALGNAGGRVLAGMISDRIGRQTTMLFAFMIQGGMVLVPYYFNSNAGILLFSVFIIGACYGANLSLFPSATKDNFGLKSFGLNYGIMFTAWGVGGLVLPRIAGMVKDATGNASLAFHAASILMIIASMLTFLSRRLSMRSVPLQASDKPPVPGEDEAMNAA